MESLIGASETEREMGRYSGLYYFLPMTWEEEEEEVLESKREERKIGRRVFAVTDGCRPLAVNLR